MPFERDESELGALWSKTGGRGEYLTGKINGVGVVCFRNDKHVEGDNLPAWRVLKAKPKGERATAADDQDPPF